MQNKYKYQDKTMNQKPRITLDSSGLRYRPRTYLDSYVPKKVPKIEIRDVAPTEKLAIKPTRSTIHIDTISHQARRLLVAHETPQQRSDPVPHPNSSTHEPAAMHQEHSISNLISAIQGPKRDAETHVKKKHSVGIFVSSFLKRGAVGITTAIFVVVATGVAVAFVSSMKSGRLASGRAQVLRQKAQAASESADEQHATDSKLTEEPLPQSVIDNYATGADMPRYISIPKIKVDKTRVLRMGVDDSGLIKVPRSIWDTGWYESSAKPGDTQGASLIVGHIEGESTEGVFYDLYRLTEADEITLTMGDGHTYKYAVVSKEEVPDDTKSMDGYLVSKTPDKQGLTLMTVAGEYNQQTKTYDHRLAVFAIRTN